MPQKSIEAPISWFAGWVRDDTTSPRLLEPASRAAENATKEDDVLCEILRLSEF